MLVEEAGIYRKIWYEKGCLHPEKLIALNLIHDSEKKSLPLFVTENGLSSKLYDILRSGSDVQNDYDFFLDFTAELSGLSGVHSVVSIDQETNTSKEQNTSPNKAISRPLEMRTLDFEFKACDDDGKELFTRKMTSTREKAESLLLFDHPNTRFMISDRLSRSHALPVGKNDSLEELFLRRYHYFQDASSEHEWSLYLTADQNCYLELYKNTARHDAPILQNRFQRNEINNFDLKKSMTGAVELQIPALFEALNELDVNEKIPPKAYDPVTSITADLHTGKSITDEELTRTERKIKDHLSSDDHW